MNRHQLEVGHAAGNGGTRIDLGNGRSTSIRSMNEQAAGLGNVKQRTCPVIGRACYKKSKPGRSCFNSQQGSRVGNASWLRVPPPLRRSGRPHRQTQDGRVPPRVDRNRHATGGENHVRSSATSQTQHGWDPFGVRIAKLIAGQVRVTGPSNFWPKSQPPGPTVSVSRKEAGAVTPSGSAFRAQRRSSDSGGF